MNQMIHDIHIIPSTGLCDMIYLIISYLTQLNFFIVVNIVFQFIYGLSMYYLYRFLGYLILYFSTYSTVLSS